MICSMRWLTGSSDARSEPAVTGDESVKPLRTGVVVDVDGSRIHLCLPEDFIDVDEDDEFAIVFREDTDLRKRIGRPPMDRLVARSNVVTISGSVCPVPSSKSPALWWNEIVFGKSTS